MKYSLLPLVTMLVLLPVPLLADVQSAGEQNMSVQATVTVTATPEATWGHLLKIGTWWSSDHTWSGDAKNLTLNAVPGGGFDESLPGNGFVRHMQVIYSDPGKKLRMTGLLGPLVTAERDGYIPNPVIRFATRTKHRGALWFRHHRSLVT